MLDQAEAPNSLEGRHDVPWHLIWRQPRPNGGPGARIELAAALPFDHYLCIDDDVFLTAAQIKMLMFMQSKEPGRAHGVWGQVVFSDAEGKYQLLDGIIRRNADVSFLNQVYAFTKVQAQEAMVLASLAGFESWVDVRFGDDLLLSCSGEAAPRIHDLGPLEQCPTANEPGIAQWKQAGFREQRLELAAKMLSLGRLHVEARRPAHLI